MSNRPLFRYSLNLKVFIYAGLVMLAFLLISAIAFRFQITQVPLIIFLCIIFLILGISLWLFLYYITFPLTKISQEILNLLTGKNYQNIPPIRNDEIGIITHFFNTVTDRIKDLSGDISESKRMSAELLIASQIQSDVFPRKVPENIIGLDIVAKSRASSEVGGDCFDFLQNGSDFLVYIGDVTGHGVPAGLIMMLVSTTIRALINEKIPPKDVLIKTNALLQEKISSNHFMSLVMLRWDNMKQKMSYIGAGHEYILHYSMADKKVYAIKSEGIALKMVSDISGIIQENLINFQEGDSILLYTDGIVEAKNKQNEMYGLERLKMVFLQNAYRKAGDMFDKVSEEFSKFVGPNHIQQDDITMIIIKNIGQYAPESHIKLTVNTDEDSKFSNKTAWDWS